MIDADSHAISATEQLWELVGEPLPRVLAKEMPALDERAQGVHRRLAVPRDGDDGRRRVVRRRPEGRAGGFRHRAGGDTPTCPRVPRQSPFRRRPEPRHRPGIGLLFVVPGISETLRVNGFARLTRDPELLAACAVDGRQPWFVADVEVRQVFSHCGKAFLRSHLWQPDVWPDPDAITSPSQSIAGLAAEERRRESEVRREVEDSYRPGVLYGEPASE